MSGYDLLQTKHGTWHARCQVNGCLTVQPNLQTMQLANEKARQHQATAHGVDLGRGMHGTYAMYFRAKCRCADCSEYQRARVARNRADRLARGAFEHGTRNGYDCGCRCKPCSAARRRAYEAERSAA